MSKEKNDIIDLAKQAEQQAEFEQNKMYELKKQAFTDVISLLKSCVNKIVNKNDFAESILDELQSRINDKEDRIRTNDLVRLYELVNKNDTDRILGILSLLKDNQKPSGSTGNNTDGIFDKPKIQPDVSETDVKKAKALLSVFEKLGLSEFTEKEKK